MITSREIANTANEWQLRHDVVEKDYVLGWLLAGIGGFGETGAWAFKGGTCLRKCWFETYRFSEDLDFTVREPDTLEPHRLVEVFADIGAWIRDRSGLEIQATEASFRQRQNKRGQPTIEGRISYAGPLGIPSEPKVKLDLTADEVIALPLEDRPVFHPFGDIEDGGHGHTDHLADINSYSLPEVLGEKLRALVERCRPRDLYDVVHTYKHPDLLGRADAVMDVLAQKCAHVGIEVPTLDTIRATPFRSEVETEWANMLGHQLPFLPPFTAFWEELDSVFAWLNGQVTIPALGPIPMDDQITDWRPARYMTTWQTGAPLELIRFAGANRLKVILDYYPEVGQPGPRIVEPYALRETQTGNLILRARNDSGEPRTYRIDRISGVSIEPETFTPQYTVEF